MVILFKKDVVTNNSVLTRTVRGRITGGGVVIKNTKRAARALEGITKTASCFERFELFCFMAEGSEGI